MTEVARVGELGLVQGQRVAASEVLLLHLVPHSVGASDFHLHGSTKDIRGRHQYFNERGVSYDVFYHRRNLDQLKDVLTGDNLPDYTHILVDGSFTFKDWKFLTRRWPKAKRMFRSHNSELPHRLDAVRALSEVAATDDTERLAQNRIDTRLNRRVFFDRDLAAARFADCILTIETLKTASRYWSWLGFKGELVELPYFLPEEYVSELAAEVRRLGASRRDWVLCVTSSHPGPLTYHGLLRFHQAVSNLGDRKPEWKFRATGRALWVKKHAAYTSRVKPLGIVDNLYKLTAISRAVAVLSDRGRGFKTKILEAILGNSWVLVNPRLYRRLPEVVRPYCVIVDPDSPFSLDEALARIDSKVWPHGDPNAVLREQADRAMDAVLLRPGPRPNVKGATLGQPPKGSRKSSVTLWSDNRTAGSPKVTFCTVLTPVHKKVAAHNWELVKHLNPDFEPRWQVVDNHDLHMAGKKNIAFLRQLKEVRGKPARDVRDLYLQRAKEEYYDYGDIAEYMPGANITSGWSLQETFDYYYPRLNSRPQDVVEHRRLLQKFLASYHHASGLNLALQKVDSRYAVVIDPDLYVLRPNWLHDVIDHMTKNDLACFGVPWNPRWYWKYRYFPCTHLMVLDLEKCPWRWDLLAPDLVNYGQKFISKFWLEQARLQNDDPPAARKHLRKNLRRAFNEDLVQRRTIAESGDTGYCLIEEFDHNPALKYEAAIPVFSVDMGFQPASVTPLQRQFDALLPDRWSYLPKRPHSMSANGFKEFGLPNCRQWGWEEFLWKDEPFAFHVRGELHRKPVGRTDDVQAWNAINAALARAGQAPLADRTWAGADLEAPEVNSWRRLDEEYAGKRHEQGVDAPPVAETQAAE